jgi:hypothetical protein
MKKAELLRFGLNLSMLPFLFAVYFSLSEAEPVLG